MRFFNERTQERFPFTDHLINSGARGGLWIGDGRRKYLLVICWVGGKLGLSCGFYEIREK
jgi:hypothetical protein